jgi:hypothetical protein
MLIFRTIRTRPVNLVEGRSPQGMMHEEQQRHPTLSPSCWSLLPFDGEIRAHHLPFSPESLVEWQS